MLKSKFLLLVLSLLFSIQSSYAASACLSQQDKVYKQCSIAIDSGSSSYQTGCVSKLAYVFKICSAEELLPLCPDIAEFAAEACSTNNQNFCGQVLNYAFLCISLQL